MMLETELPESMPQISIQAEPQPDPLVCRFTVDRDLFPGGSYLCKDPERARGSNLLELLFAIEGVRQVWIAGAQVTIQKSNDLPWAMVGKKVGAAIRAHVALGSPFFPPATETGTQSAPLFSSQPSLEKRAREIQSVLNTQINPMVAGHGGRIELAKIEGQRVFVQMLGGCQGCGSSRMTLRNGVEKALRARFPEITEVVDMTDHDAGKNPYYK